MGFPIRIKYHDQILNKVLPDRFRQLGLHFEIKGFEKTLKQNGMLISSLEDGVSLSTRFSPDGQVTGKQSYLVELKTVLPTQTSPNYDFEMAPWEKAMQLNSQGTLVVYSFWPAERAAWFSDTKPDWIGVPKWRWPEQDYLRIKHRYEHICPVWHIKKVDGGSGTVFGIIQSDRIRAMLKFDEFWMEVSGKWQPPKQLRLE